MHLVVFSLIAQSINQNVSLTFVRCSCLRASGAEAIVDVSIAGESAPATNKAKQCTQRMIRKLSHADKKKVTSFESISLSNALVVSF